MQVNKQVKFGLVSRNAQMDENKNNTWKSFGKESVLEIEEA